MVERNSKRPKQTTKHIPQRTCIGCRAVAGKRGLIRLVRTPDGVTVDTTGKLAGRGAYIHPTRTCWERVLAGNQISQALRMRLSADNRAALQTFAETLPDEPVASQDVVSSEPEEAV